MRETVYARSTGDVVLVNVQAGRRAGDMADAGVLTMPVGLWLELLDRLDPWPHSFIDRGPCTDCGHPQHLGDVCADSGVVCGCGETARLRLVAQGDRRDG